MNKTHRPPKVSAWHQALASGTLFEVVVTDEPIRAIECPLFDSELSAVDLSTWRQPPFVPMRSKTGAPGPFFELNSENQAYSDNVLVPEYFSGALLNIEPESLDLGDDYQIICASNPIDLINRRPKVLLPLTDNCI